MSHIHISIENVSFSYGGAGARGARTHTRSGDAGIGARGAGVHTRSGDAGTGARGTGAHAGSGDAGTGAWGAGAHTRSGDAGTGAQGTGTHAGSGNAGAGAQGPGAVLHDINLHAAEHESIGIIGANGVGKSTLLKLLVGLEPNFTGTIRIEDIPLEKSTLGKIRERIGYVFQDSDSQLFMTTVGEDVAFAPRNYGLPEAEVNRRVDEALARVHISHLRDKSIYKLSGGEKKLVSIATILSTTPDMILMDEPSVALDPKNRRNLISIINEFDHLKMIASHDLDFIWDTCRRTVLMNAGRIVWDGPTGEIMQNRTLLEENGLELPLSLCRR